MFPVKSLLRNILSFIATGLFIICTGYLLQPVFEINNYITDLVILSIVFTLISILTISVFLRGQSKEPQSQAMHTLVSFGIKFLLELILALLWFIVAKKTSTQSVFMFFVLYLTFSLILIFTGLKTLKNKAL